MKFIELTSWTEVRNVLSSFTENDLVAIDTETTGLDPRQDKLKDIIVSGDEHTAYIFSANFVRSLTFHLNPKVPLLLQNFRFDYNFLWNAGIDLLPHPMIDTMLLHHLWDENKSHGLDAMVQEFFGDNYKEAFWEKYKTYEEAPRDEQIRYACLDVIYLRKVYKILRDDARVPQELVEQVHRFAIALYKTERDGLAIDLDYLMHQGTELSTRINQLRDEIKQTIPRAIETLALDLWTAAIQKAYTPKGKKWLTLPKPEINLDSNKQLATLLYDILRLPEQVNKEKKRTTDDSALTALQNAHSIVPKIQEYRGHQKVFTAFIEGTREKLYQGRIYPSFNVNGTVTGRISSSNPNMQQLPRDGGVRGMYIPDAGHRLITCDYSQLEICLAAHFSNDPVLLDLIHSGKSMHDNTARAIWGESFTKEHRQVAKTLNFLRIYGGTEYRAAVVLGVSIPEAKRILDIIDVTYLGLKNAIDECHAKVKAGTPIINPYGRRRNFPEGLEGRELQRAQRQGFNALVQGTGADLTNFSFTEVSLEMERLNYGKALFPVHDENVIMPKEKYCNESIEMLKFHMIEAGKKIKLRVPLSVECSEPLERWTK